MAAGRRVLKNCHKELILHDVRDSLPGAQPYLIRQRKRLDLAPHGSSAPLCEGPLGVNARILDTGVCSHAEGNPGVAIDDLESLPRRSSVHSHQRTRLSAAEMAFSGGNRHKSVLRGRPDPSSVQPDTIPSAAEAHPPSCGALARPKSSGVQEAQGRGLMLWHVCARSREESATRSDREDMACGHIDVPTKQEAAPGAPACEGSPRRGAKMPAARAGNGFEQAHGVETAGTRSGEQSRPSPGPRPRELRR